jgi:hypothetical protein
VISCKTGFSCGLGKKTKYGTNKSLHMTFFYTEQKYQFTFRDFVDASAAVQLVSDRRRGGLLSWCPPVTKADLGFLSRQDEDLFGACSY